MYRYVYICIYCIYVMNTCNIYIYIYIYIYVYMFNVMYINVKWIMTNF